MGGLTTGSLVPGQDAAAGEDAAVAMERLQQAARERPRDSSVLLTLGNALAEAGETVRAVEVYGAILAMDAACGHAWNNLGNIFVGLKDMEGALACFQNAVRLLPDEATAHYSFGRALALVGRETEALEHLSQACALDPDRPDAWITLGNVHQYLGQWDAALRCFDRALALRPGWAEPHVNRAVVLLNQGEFRRGWAEYEFRWETVAFRAYKERPFDSRPWKGEPLEGKSILLHAEQGFGDAIQFARFIPAVRALGAEVFLEIRAPLVELFRQLVALDHIVVAGEPRPSADFHCGFLSVAAGLGVELETIPTSPYLKVPRGEVDAAAGVLRRLARGGGSLRVGLSWRGNPSHPWDFKRSVTLAQLAPLAGVAGVQWYALQADVTAEELAGWPALAVLPGEWLEGFERVAAVTEALDLVISVDTVHAHLAGALGKPVWLLLSLFYEWRWHAHLEESPWYPSARLFRQEAPGDWAGAVARMAAALAALTAGEMEVRS